MIVNAKSPIYGLKGLKLRANQIHYEDKIKIYRWPKLKSNFNTKQVQNRFKINPKIKQNQAQHRF